MRSHPYWLLALLAIVAVLISFGPPGATSQNPDGTPAPDSYAVHTKITATIFWAGEPASGDSGNENAAWCQPWSHCFGGVDDPNNRNGDWPAGFKPKSNPFYAALPCSDLGGSGLREDFRPYVAEIPWVADGSAAVSKGTSVLKDRWIGISYGDKVVYAQWEDTGPGNFSDCGYVLSRTDARPANTSGPQAGIDLSPAAALRLGLKGSGMVSWWFVKQPPPGPWTVIVTDAPPYYQS